MIKKTFLILSCLVFLPFIVLAQSEPAKASFNALVSRLDEKNITSIAIEEAAELDSIDDSIWLMANLADATSSDIYRKILLSDKASLLELSGHYVDAALAWEAVAKAIPGKVDYNAMLSAAACRLAAGDVEAAAMLANTVSFSSPDPVTEDKAQVIRAWYFLTKGDLQTALSIARKLIEGGNHPGTLAGLLLARSATEGTEREVYQSIILKNFPSRPESSSPLPSTLYLLMASTVPMIRISDEKKQTEPIGETVSESVVATVFQVGAFKDEANANLLKSKLSRLGLEAFARLKESSGLHIVYVMAGKDEEHTVLVLKDAGYEAWRLELKF